MVLPDPLRGAQGWKIPSAGEHDGLVIAGTLGCGWWKPPRPSFFMTDGTSDPFGILSIALQLVHGATEGLSSGAGLVFPADDLPSLVNDDVRGLGRRFPCTGVGG